MTNKSYISLFLLAIWLLPQGFDLASDIRKWELKLHEHTGQHTDKQTIQLKAVDVRWMDKNEIYVSGKMFDIREKKLENGWYTFTGFFDEPESELITLQHQSTQAEKDNSLLSALFQYLQQIYFNPSTQIQTYWIAASHSWAIPDPTGPVLQCHDILTPPPRTLAFT